MDHSFKDRVALVTGAASGIGRAAAFAKAGADVVVSDVDEVGGLKTVQMIQAMLESSGQALFVQTDVTKPDDVEALIEAVLDAYGQIDFALNNAGIVGTRTNTADYPEELWHQVIDVNLNGVWYCMKYEISQWYNP